MQSNDSHQPQSEEPQPIAIPSEVAEFLTGVMRNNHQPADKYRVMAACGLSQFWLAYELSSITNPPEVQIP